MKSLRIMCAAAIICMLPAAAFAADDIMLIASNPTDGAATAQPAGDVTISSFGTVEEVGAGFVTVKMDDGALVARAQLNIGAETVILDSATGESVKLADIKAGERVLAYYSDKLSKSIPAQTELLALFTNAEEATPGVVWTVEEVAHSNSNSKILTVNNGDLLLTVTTDQPIKVGDRVAAWYDTVMMSLPAQAVAERVVVLSSVDTAVPEEVKPGVAVDMPASAPQVVKVNGKTVHAVVERLNGEVCVPLRLIAEELGYTLTWDGNKMAATITKDGVSTEVTMGSDTIVTDGDMAHKLGAGVYLRNREKMMVPVDMFKELGFAVSVGEQVEIGVAILS